MCLVLYVTYICTFYVCLSTYEFICENLYVLKKTMKHIMVSDEWCKIAQKLCSGNNRRRWPMGHAQCRMPVDVHCESVCDVICGEFYPTLLLAPVDHKGGEEQTSLSMSLPVLSYLTNRVIRFLI